MPKIPLELTISADLVNFKNNCDRVNNEVNIDSQQGLICFQGYAHAILKQISLLRGPYDPNEYEVASTDFNKYCEIINLYISHSYNFLLILLAGIEDARQKAYYWHEQVSLRWNNYLKESQLRECVVLPEELRRRADTINFQKKVAFFVINIATRSILGCVGEVAANASVGWVLLENTARIAASTTVSAALNTAVVHYIDPDVNAYETFMQSAQKAFLFNTFNQAGHDVICHAGQVGLKDYEYIATSSTDLAAGAVDAYILNSIGQSSPVAKPETFNCEAIAELDVGLHDWVRDLSNLVENTGSMTLSSSVVSSLVFFDSPPDSQVKSEDSGYVLFR